MGSNEVGDSQVAEPAEPSARTRHENVDRCKQKLLINLLFIQSFLYLKVTIRGPVTIFVGRPSSLYS